MQIHLQIYGSSTKQQTIERVSNCERIVQTIQNLQSKFSHNSLYTKQNIFHHYKTPTIIYRHLLGVDISWTRQKIKKCPPKQKNKYINTCLKLNYLFCSFIIFQGLFKPFLYSLLKDHLKY